MKAPPQAAPGRCPGCGPDYCAIRLVNPKSPENVGAVMRAAGCYRADGRSTTRGSASRAGAAFVTDTKRMVEKIPCSGSRELLDFVPGGCTLCWWI